MMAAAEKEFCQSNLIVAYVDGELEQAAAEVLEQHFENCDDCRAELRAHQMFICELDAALAERIAVDLPSDFSRVVAMRAASDMRGVRSRSEKRKALIFALSLALVSFVLIGAQTREAGFGLVRKLANSLWGLVSFVVATCFDIMASVIVISRVLTGRIVSELRVFGLLLVLLATAVFLLSHLISKYHRMGAIE